MIRSVVMEDDQRCCRLMAHAIKYGYVLDQGGILMLPHPISGTAMVPIDCCPWCRAVMAPAPAPVVDPAAFKLAVEQLAKRAERWAK